MSEETLPGGNTDGAVRIGGVVHKRASPWTPTVHALLRHLEYADVDGVPRALGFDDQGRQMLTYLPGDVIGDSIPWPAWAYADSTLVQVGQWMRRIHDATAAFIPPKDERWFTGRTMQPGWIVGHQDAAPYNAVMDGDRLVGFFDWDTASPSPRDDDLAFSALLWVPLTAPDAGEQPDSHEVMDRSRRLHLLLDAYRYDGDRRAFGAVIVQRARRQAGVIRSMAEAGDTAAIALLPHREPPGAVRVVRRGAAGRLLDALAQPPRGDAAIHVIMSSVSRGRQHRGTLAFEPGFSHRTQRRAAPRGPRWCPVAYALTGCVRNKATRRFNQL